MFAALRVTLVCCCCCRGGEDESTSLEVAACQAADLFEVRLIHKPFLPRGDNKVLNERKLDLR